jgi:hypothetical protein
MDRENLKRTRRRYQEIIDKANTTYVRDVLDRVREDREKLRAKNNDIFNEQSDYTQDIPTCGTIAESEYKIDVTDIPALEENVSDILSEIQRNPMEFPDIVNAIPEVSNQQAGTQGGNPIGKGIFEIQDIGIPQWVKELEIAVKDWSEKQRDRSKDWHDVEDLTFYGIESKEKAKKLEPKSKVIVMLDTSGSMCHGGCDGRSYIQMLGAYIPPIVKNYEGQLWLCDDAVRERFPFSQIRYMLTEEGFAPFAGGGGTNFDLVFKEWLAMKEIDGSDFMGIVLTDGGVSYDNSVEIIRRMGNVVLVQPEESKSSLAPLKGLIESDKYPNIRAVSVRCRD